MAHTTQAGRRPEEFLTFPLRFNASPIKIIGDAVQAGEWIIGYPPKIPGEEDRWTDTTSFSVGRDAVEDLLSKAVSDVGSHPPNGEAVRRFLLRNGTFRQWDWHRVDEVLGSDLPVELKKDLQRVNFRPKAEVYVLPVRQFYQEWELLRLLALIAGKLAEKANPLLVRSEVETAQKILKQLSISRSLPIRSNSDDAGWEALFWGDATKKGNRKAIKLASHKSLAESIRIRITDLYASAFLRGIGQGKFGIGWSRFNAGPRVALNVESTLGVAYLGLLANFSRGWKNCGREDCGNIFRVTDDKRKQFCSQYCGHLVSLRNSRKKSTERGHRPGLGKMESKR